MEKQALKADLLEFKDLVQRFERKSAEIVFHWKDPETEAEGWLVINSLRGGSAGGGTRMRKGLDQREVESLAKTMEIKFSVSGPAIGGAKSGINFDPSDPRKSAVLERWFRAVMPLLKQYYGTGGDLNIDEIHEVIPITLKLGLHHPQEGTVVGHLRSGEVHTAKIIHQLQQGVKKRITAPDLSPDLKSPITVADMITGYGVACSIRHHYQLHEQHPEGKRALIQGWGNVGAAAGFYLAQMGVRIVGIIDKNAGLISKDGFSFPEVRELFLSRSGNQLNSQNSIPYDRIKKEIWHTEAEIFIPAAASRLIHQDHVRTMVENGLELISCGSNVPFADNEILFGPIAESADSTLSVIPDFIANCGMARVFRYLMQDDIRITDEAIFADVSDCILNALKRVYDVNPGLTGISQTALELAIRDLL